MTQKTRQASKLESEKLRIEKISQYERDAYFRGLKYVAGIDEAGRGPLAGPVVAAAVMLPKSVFIVDLKDSKKLSPKKREIVFEEIKIKALGFSIGIVDEKCIDDINILNATKLAMRRAVEGLEPKPELLLIDALNLDNIGIKQLSINQGDNLSISIAAASILAKVTRDRMMEEYDTIYPLYGFKKHKGYGTKEHIKAIGTHGICPLHRVSFTRKFILK